MNINFQPIKLYALQCLVTMHYIILTKLEYPASVSLKVKGLFPNEIESLKKSLDMLNVKHSNSNKDFFEVDIIAVEMLNLLSKKAYGYRVICQSMAMEHSDLGGRSFQIEKIVWTLGKETASEE